jgi:protein-glutamine gamma-glutamyltransferase
MSRSEARLDGAHLLPLFAGLVLATAPHARHLPWWVNVWLVLFLAWRVFLVVSARALPHRIWLTALSIAAMIGVYLTFRTIFGRDAGVALLAMLASMKLLELRVMRDVYVVVFLAYFLALTNFFYSQTMPTAALMLATVVVITASLVGLNDISRRFQDNLRTAAVLLLQASPVMLLLFFLFPRVTGPLWGLPQDAFAGVTGLSDTMSPGSLSRLSQSDAIVLRARFDGNPPPRRQLYWRGPVLWRFDGRTWSGGNLRFFNAYNIVSLGTALDYEITLEPHNRNWLFALDLPGRIPPLARITQDYQLLSLPLVRARMRYEMRSYPAYRATSGADERDLAIALSVPARGNPRARELAAQWRQVAGNGADANRAVARQALDFFRAGKYEYTLDPPLLGANTVDEFLFDSKQGFCEHFASSFAFLMRAAGVPARVVTGYQGGEVNPIDGYLEVRQADAHAWDEVWLGSEGWVRVDPTGTAVPLRVDSGIAAALPQNAALPLLIRTNIEWLRTLRFNWDALANKWNQWVLGYNVDRQREMLSYFGVRSPDWRTLTVLLFWSVAGAVGLMALWLLARVRRRRDPVQRAWMTFCAKLARCGIARGPSEGPRDYGARAIASLPQRAQAIDSITRLYVDLRYGRGYGAPDAARLGALVKAFKL